MPYIKKKQQSRPWTKRKRRSSEYGNSDSTFYNSTNWRKTSKMARMENPVCAICNKRYSEMTDHIISINVGGARLDGRNLLTMCNQCHNIKRGLESHTDKPLVSTRVVPGGLIPSDRNDIINLLKDRVNERT